MKRSNHSSSWKQGPIKPCLSTTMNALFGQPLRLLSSAMTPSPAVSVSVPVSVPATSDPVVELTKQFSQLALAIQATLRPQMANTFNAAAPSASATASSNFPPGRIALNVSGVTARPILNEIVLSSPRSFVVRNSLPCGAKVG